MSRLALFGFLCLGVGAFAFQGSLPSLLSNHAKALHDAASFSATFTVQPSGGAPETYTLKYAKPNLIKIERPDNLLICDGRTVYEYTKSKNVYSEFPATDADVQLRTAMDEVWAWAPFFMPDPVKGYRAGKAGTNRILKGNPVTEVEVALGGDREGTATLFIDNKLGVARALRIKQGTGELLVIAGNIQVSSNPAQPNEFMFAPPAGAKRAEDVKPAATFESVRDLFGRTCMPCHGPNQMSGGMNLTTYDGIKAGVSPGDPDNSRIVRALRASGRQRMPQNRPPLRPAEIDLVAKWIADGANP